MSDPIAPHSAPIAAYMSVHEGLLNITAALRMPVPTL